MKIVDILKEESKFCFACMETHDVETVVVYEETLYKEIEFKFRAIYEYCKDTDMLTETEELMKNNSLKMIQAYEKIING